MNRFLTTFTLTILLIVSATNAEEEKEEAGACDKVLDSMIDGCKSIRNTLISTDSLDPKVACCKNARYDLCVQGVKGYTTVARSTRICSEETYETKVQALEENVAMKAIKKLCENFDTKTCITDSVTSTWGSITETLNPENLGNTISKTFNDAISSISSFTKNLGQQTQEGASSLSTRLSGMLPNQAANQYSVDNQPAEGGFSFSKLFNSITNPVEVVPKEDNKKKDDSNSNQLFQSITGIFRPNN